MRKKDETMRDTLLTLARAMADEDGASAINIRTLAQRAGVASGTVYNYFADKDELLLALTEQYWREQLVQMQGAIHSSSFVDQLSEIYSFLLQCIGGSAGTLMGSLGSTHAGAQVRMSSMQQVLRNAVLRRMHGDSNIRQDIWNDEYSIEAFADFVVINMVALLRSGASDIAFFVETVRRILY